MLSDKRGTPRICNYEYTIMSGKFRMRGGKYGIHFFKESHVLQVKDTKVWFISQILKKHPICLPG